MCLNQLTTVYNPPDQTEYIGYKFGLKQGNDFQTLWDQRVYPLGVWHQASLSKRLFYQYGLSLYSPNTCNMLLSLSGECYPIGFHVYKTHKITESFEVCVIKVKYRNVLATGIDLSERYEPNDPLEKFACDVAQEIMFMEFL